MNPTFNDAESQRLFEEFLTWWTGQASGGNQNAGHDRATFAVNPPLPTDPYPFKMDDDKDGQATPVKKEETDDPFDLDNLMKDIEKRKRGKRSREDPEWYVPTVFKAF